MDDPKTIEEFHEYKDRMRSEDFRRLAAGEITAEALQEENSIWPKHATSKVNYADYFQRVNARLKAKALDLRLSRSAERRLAQR